MRLLLIATLSLALTPSVALAQNWQDWANSNPTYPELSQPAPAAPASTPTRSSAPVRKSAPARQSAPAPRPRRSVAAPPAPAPTAQFDTRDPAFTRAFMDGCTLKAGQQAKQYCACALKHMQDNYTFEEMATIVQFTNETGQLSRELEGMIYACIDQLGAADTLVIGRNLPSYMPVFQHLNEQKMV